MIESPTVYLVQRYDSKGAFIHTMRAFRLESMAIQFQKDVEPLNTNIEKVGYVT